MSKKERKDKTTEQIEDGIVKKGGGKESEPLQEELQALKETLAATQKMRERCEHGLELLRELARDPAFALSEEELRAKIKEMGSKLEKVKNDLVDQADDVAVMEEKIKSPDNFGL